MIIDKLNRWERVAGMHPAFKMVFDFIGRTDFSHMPAGRIALDGERVFINLDEPEGTTREEQVLEVHRRYIDIHVPLDAVEEVGWKPLEEIEHFSVAYDATLDRAFPTTARVSTPVCAPASFALYSPRTATPRP